MQASYQVPVGRPRIPSPKAGFIGTSYKGGSRATFKREEIIRGRTSTLAKEAIQTGHRPQEIGPGDENYPETEHAP